MSDQKQELNKNNNHKHTPVSLKTSETANGIACRVPFIQTLRSTAQVEQHA
jgi:hypothetical protein